MDRFPKCIGCGKGSGAAQIGTPEGYVCEKCYHGSATRWKLMNQHRSTHHGNLAHEDCPTCRKEMPEGFFNA